FVLLFEAVHATGRVHQLLTARKERVAGGADFHADIALVGRAGFERVTARADHIDFVVGGVNTNLHLAGGFLSRNFSIASKTPVNSTNPRGLVALDLPEG